MKLYEKITDTYYKYCFNHEDTNKKGVIFVYVYLYFVYSSVSLFPRVPAF